MKIDKLKTGISMLRGLTIPPFATDRMDDLRVVEGVVAMLEALESEAEALVSATAEEHGTAIRNISNDYPTSSNSRSTPAAIPALLEKLEEIKDRSRKERLAVCRDILDAVSDQDGWRTGDILHSGNDAGQLQAMLGKYNAGSAEPDETGELGVVVGDRLWEITRLTTMRYEWDVDECTGQNPEEKSIRDGVKALRKEAAERAMVLWQPEVIYKDSGYIRSLVLYATAGRAIRQVDITTPGKQRAVIIRGEQVL